MASIPRIPPLGACAAAVASGAVFLFPGLAAASPDATDGSDLANTTCSADQLQSAVRKEAPKFWQRISSDPEKLDKFHQRLQDFLDKSPEDRQASLDEMKSHAADWADEHPDKAEQAKGNQAGARETFRRVVSTCDQY